MASGERGGTRADQWREQREREDRGARVAALFFVVAIVAAFGLMFVYVAGGQTQLEGLLLFIAFGAVGTGLGVWGKKVVGPKIVVEERYPMRSSDQSRDAFEAAYEESLGEAVVGGRRRFLLRLLAGAGASLGLALLVPLRSLGPGPGGDMFVTEWQDGRRLVDASGNPIRPEQMSADEVRTVFPEGAEGDAKAQALLIGTRPDQLDRDALPRETVDDLVCYSKICTHAGCPVGLYRASVGELICPCHQSTFDVNRAAIVVSGPAGRGLPQLPLGVDDAGYLVATGDFSEPVGPSFWNMTHDVQAEDVT
ncbi:Rieske 2Fe-2S domain-containing protein [Egicoccus sp. AB-alg6-2]|uniref:ubiquinol-cytochrome c reductase iron-sulfur subunit n=1 Tax=Egicoccus sp. AB-alg6-2 TaxID=3242692 RepID=UPI00359E0339